MCGLAGFLGAPRSIESATAILEKMSVELAQRGPDSQGSWISADGAVGLTHRRLSVLGGSVSGAQPMTSESGRFVLIYNGEIYNFRDIRAEIEDPGEYIPGDSDTRILLQAIETYGLDRALQKLVGMFSFVLWDKHDATLTLVRDRFGEKPLYYGWKRRSFVFGSTLGPLRQHPDWDGEVSREAVSSLISTNYIAAPLSIYSDISKLTPGTYLKIEWRRDTWVTNKSTYWSAIQTAQRARRKLFSGDFNSAADELEGHLTRMIRGRMCADVPMGAFLSGGVDSGTVVALMQELSIDPIKTFTVKFDDEDYDESTYAAAIAKHLGTSHTTEVLTQSRAIELVTALPSIYDEPFADSSQIPTALICKAARERVTVVLTGDGGDEMFAGYNRHRWASHIRSLTKRIPKSICNLLGDLICLSKRSHWNRIAPHLPASIKLGSYAEKCTKLRNILNATSDLDVYLKLIGSWNNRIPIINDRAIRSNLDLYHEIFNTSLDFREKILLADTVAYLPDDILVKVDRASMNVGLEARPFFLDHLLYEFLWSLPPSYLFTSGRSKGLLRRVLYKRVPSSFYKRPKSGFALPLGEYLRISPLRDWAESLLDPIRLKNDGYFNSVEVRKTWTEHLAGQANLQNELWGILMFQAWTDSH